MTTMDYRFRTPSGETYDFDVTKAAAAVGEMWRRDVPERLPYQLLNLLDENVVLRFVGSVPPDLAELCPDEISVYRRSAPGLDGVRRESVQAHAVCAKSIGPEGGWRLLWTVPIVENGVGELLIWDHVVEDEVLEMFR